MPKRYAYNTSATQVKKRYAMIGATATQVKKRYGMIGSTATLVYTARETKSLAVSHSDHNNTYTLNWDTVNCGRGWSKADYTVNISNTDGIFYVGISTSATKPANTAVEKPDGAVLNFKSVNGDVTGTKTGTLTLDSSKTYYLYVASYFGAGKTGSASISVTFE